MWLAGRVGWAQFYQSGTEDWASLAYVNDLDHPGFTAQAIEENINITDQKNIKISGIAADSLELTQGKAPAAAAAAAAAAAIINRAMPGLRMFVYTHAIF